MRDVVDRVDIILLCNWKNNETEGHDASTSQIGRPGKLASRKVRGINRRRIFKGVKKNNGSKLG